MNTCPGDTPKMSAPLCLQNKSAFAEQGLRWPRPGQEPLAALALSAVINSAANARPQTHFVKAGWGRARRDAARPQPPPEGRPGHGEGWELTLQAQDSSAILHLVSTGTGGFAAESFCRVLPSVRSVSVPSVMEKELQERRRAWLELRLGVHVDQGNTGTLPGFQKPEAPSLSCKPGPFPTALSSPSALSTKGVAVRTLLHMDLSVC